MKPSEEFREESHHYTPKCWTAGAEEGPFKVTYLWKCEEKVLQDWRVYSNKFKASNHITATEMSMWKAVKSTPPMTLEVTSQLLGTSHTNPYTLGTVSHRRFSEPTGPVCHIAAAFLMKTGQLRRHRNNWSHPWTLLSFQEARKIHYQMWEPSIWFPKQGQEVNIIHDMGWYTLPFWSRITNKKQTKQIKPKKHLLPQQFQKCAGENT